MERWAAVIGYEGLYEVSTDGRVRSLDRMVRTKGGALKLLPWRMLKPNVKANGYLQVNLQDTPRPIRYAGVHRLVLEAFVGPCPDGMECRHDNGVRADNRLDNLSWGTHAENMADIERHGTRPRGERHPLSVLTHEMVSWIRESHQPGNELADLLEVSHTSVCRARAGTTYGPLAQGA
jgi:hypothetical protein